MEPANDPAFYPESARINILKDEQVDFWTKQLGVTEQQLRNAVFICGPIVKEVKKYLKQQGQLNKEG
jgi:hypothetical protein